MSNRHPLNVNVVNGRGVARAAGRATGSAIVLFAVCGLIGWLGIIAFVACMVGAVVVAVRIIRDMRTPRPVAPVQYRRVDDAAARAHRARVAAIRSTYR